MPISHHEHGMRHVWKMAHTARDDGGVRGTCSTRKHSYNTRLLVHNAVDLISIDRDLLEPRHLESASWKLWRGPC